MWPAVSGVNWKNIYNEPCQANAGVKVILNSAT